MNDIALFIHSTGTGPFLFDKAAPEASLRGLRRIAPANLGYPPLPPTPRGETVTAADDARTVLAALPDDGSGVHVFAHSYGGLVALKMLSALGGRLRSLWLFEPVMFGALARLGAAAGADAASEARFFSEHPWFLTDLERGGTDEWLELFIDYWNGKGAWKAMPPSGRAYAERLGWKMFQEVRSVGLDPQDFHDHRVAVPLTLVTGWGSPPAAREMVRQLARVNPHAVVDDLPQLAHMTLLLRGELVSPSIQAHLERVLR